MSGAISVLCLTKATGGTALYNRTLVEGLDPARFDTFTLCLSEQAEAYAADLVARGAEAEPFAMSRYSIDALGDLRVLRRARSLVRERRVDVILCHGTKSGFIGRAVGAATGVPVIYRQASLVFLRRIQGCRAPFYGALELAARAFGGHIVTLTEGAREATLRARLAGPDRVSVIRTGIDTDRFRPRGRRDEVVGELGLDPARRVVGWIGRLEPQKAPLDYVRALERVAPRHPDVQFAMAGEGRLEAEVRSALDRAGLRDRVHLLPWQADPARAYEGFDVLAMSSLWEGLPLTLLEAMATGCVPVSTDVDGCADVIEDGRSGRLVPAADPAALAAALDDVLGHADLDAMRTEARRRIETVFARDRMIGEWADLLERLPRRRLGRPGEAPA